MTSERSPEADIRPRRFNVAEVPQGDIRTVKIWCHPSSESGIIWEASSRNRLRLPSLAPDIITAIINGKNPPQLTAKKLMRLALQIPVDWTEQRKLLGFAKG